jgi:chemotaxis regulatin CheY-phosphate phosphatase CheZ
MSGRGKSTVRRRAANRAPAKLHDSGRTVAEEITVLVNTLRELAAIRATAEDAASRILDSAEGLLAFADKEEAKKAEEAILAIMTACGFHDLVGQRVTKIAETLDQVIATRIKAEKGRKRGAAPPSSEDRITLEGPGLTGMSDETQAQIDALFRDN